MIKTVCITLEQAQTALECIENDMELSKHGEVDFDDIEALMFYLRRAEVAERLRKFVSEALKG
jgi:hypothetical protein